MADHTGHTIPAPEFEYPALESRLYPQKRGEIAVYCGDSVSYVGKWRKNMHQRLIQYAYRTDRPIRVERVRDGQHLFTIQPWGRDDS